MKFFYLALMIFIFSSCNNKPYDSSVFNDPILYSKTVKELNYVVMGNNFTPIVASRNYTYATIAAYEVMVKGDDNYNSLAGQLHELKPIVNVDTNNVDFHYAAILAFSKVGESVTFPEGSMDEYLANIDSLTKVAHMSAKMKKASQLLANTIADHIIDWSKGDNYLQTRTSPRYEVIDTPARWVPTPPAYTSAIEPHWSEIRPMVIDSANQFNPPPPPVFDIKNKNSEYYKEVMSIKTAIDTITDEQKHIAEFWDDLNTKQFTSGHLMFLTKKFSPPGHWMNIVGIAAEKAKANFSQTVYAYAITAIASFDSFIHCWQVKYTYNTVRPETVINKYIDQEWRPLLQTPPFPEYTCGHTTVSATAAEALTKAFGDNFAYTDTSELEFGIDSRSFTSFRQAAEENIWARFYGGIHFHNSCIISNKYGKEVGEYIIGKLKMKKND